MSFVRFVFSVSLGLISASTSAAPPEFPLVEYLTGDSPGKMIAYAPNGLDPRNPANQVRHKTSELQADLEVLRETFDGLILYGYNESTTPRILSLAAKLKYRAVILGIWEVKSSIELDGVATEVRLHNQDFAMGVLIGNEGVLFGRYEKEDLSLAMDRMRKRVPVHIPLTTSEPHASYKDEFFLTFGDFLAPNIHPVFDAKGLTSTEAAKWARARAHELATKSGKSVLLKETGFPHGGEPKYTPETQTEFWKEYIKDGLIVREGDLWISHGVAFESFDLPWKAEASGLPIEKSWGLYDVNRKPYPVVEIWKTKAE